MILNMMMIMFAINLILVKHPLSLGLIILLQTLVICLKMGLMNFTYWLSYILFLIMIGGLLILFIYMTSIASNEKFKMSNKLILLNMSFLMISSLYMIMDKFLFINKLNNFNMNMFFMENLNNLMINKYMNMSSNMIYLLSIIYLLLTLIACVKISCTFKGPMRQMN